ncbi:MAG TPA: sugar ABC transporter permease [Candidatus Dormibacteraeota bacterium]|nr:sugar ABC transporter permease [Candidatus Dormibacteraeota bacterium]
MDRSVAVDTQPQVASDAIQYRPAASRRRGAWNRGRNDGPLKRLVINLVLLGACIVAIYPLLQVLTISLRPGDRLFSTSLALIPDKATLASYQEVLFHSDFQIWIYNSFVISTVAAILGVCFAVPAGYAFSRFRFPGKRAGLLFLLSTQMIPAGMLLIPIFLLFFKLNLIDHYLGMILAYLTTICPFSIWILKGYFDTIPPDLEEAAQVDGTTRIGAFWRVIIPLSTPPIALTFLFGFTSAWSEYLLARTVIQRAELFTWPLGIYTFQGQYQSQWGDFAAASFLISIPVLILFMFMGRWMISGLTLGGVKG